MHFIFYFHFKKKVMNSTPTTIAVLGGSGRTGNFVVHELLRQGYFVKQSGVFYRESMIK
jgi:hypothetical protein